MNDYHFSRLELERQADANRIHELEVEAEELQAEIERLRVERDEAREVAGYCLRKAFSSWPGLASVLTDFSWLEPAVQHGEIPKRKVNDE